MNKTKVVRIPTELFDVLAKHRELSNITIGKQISQAFADKKLEEELIFLCKITQMQRPELLHRIFDALTNIGAMFPNGANIELETALLPQTLTVRFHGKSCLIICSTEKDLLQSKARMFQQVKHDIAKKTKKLEIEARMKEK